MGELTFKTDKQIHCGNKIALFQLLSGRCGVGGEMGMVVGGVQFPETVKCDGARHMGSTV